MITSVVELCNIALSRLGEDGLQDLTGDTPAAVQCNLHYAHVRDEVLEDHPWRCAIYYKELAQIAEADPNFSPQKEYTYQFGLPSNPWCILPMSATDIAGKPIDYEIAHRSLFTSDIDEIILKYVRRLLDPPDFDEQLGEAMILRLASKMCLALTANRGLKNDLLGEFGTILDRARANDSPAQKTQEETPLITDVK